MTIDEKLESKKWKPNGILDIPTMVELDFAKQIIHEALKKQRDICADIFYSKDRIMEKDSPFDCRRKAILNAPEPEL